LGLARKAVLLKHLTNLRWTKENEDACRLTTIPGVGRTIASALIAAIAKASKER